MSSQNLKPLSAETLVPMKPTKQVAWGLEQMNLLNSRFSQKADKGKLRTKGEELQSQFRTCLTRLNEDLAKTKTCGDLAGSLADFWVSFVFVIQPYSDGNGRTAKFFCIKSLNQFGLATTNTWLFEEYVTLGDSQKDVLMLGGLVLENLKIFDPLLE